MQFGSILLYPKTHYFQHTHTTILRLCGFCPRQPEWAVPEETFTHSHPSWSSDIPICFLHLLRSITSSLFNPRALQSFPQSLSKFSLVYLLTGHPPLHTPYISSPNHCLLFTAHVHTIAACFVVVQRLCPLILVSLSTLYLGLYLVASRHISIWPFLSLPSEVPPHFPFLQARSHFHATYCFAHNCCTISLSSVVSLSVRLESVLWQNGWMDPDAIGIVFPVSTIPISSTLSHRELSSNFLPLLLPFSIHLPDMLCPSSDMVTTLVCNAPDVVWHPSRKCIKIWWSLSMCFLHYAIKQTNRQTTILITIVFTPKWRNQLTKSLCIVWL